jgi:hypothetical protein
MQSINSSFNNNFLSMDHPLLISRDLMNDFLQSMKNRNEVELINYSINLLNNCKLNRNDLIQLLSQNLSLLTGLSPETAFRAASIFRKLIFNHFSDLHPLDATHKNFLQCLINQISDQAGNQTPIHFELMIMHELMESNNSPVVDLSACVDQICKKMYLSGILFSYSPDELKLLLNIEVQKTQSEIEIVLDSISEKVLKNFIELQNKKKIFQNYLLKQNKEEVYKKIKAQEQNNLVNLKQDKIIKINRII